MLNLIRHLLWLHVIPFFDLLNNNQKHTQESLIMRD